eukprot:CAMPEP_0183441142 /NCGR_PEP_ID=MMETSP0370-20130417/83863_1 /TAXON_ID=268820 /ORGANISM="Peridinium aciculiferum, Strain PAER-2" /LENGTH=154 /DNA_ID=CAMNT_0025630247 /DNA_START=75 /DNA_END=539 /DNA_ORIENTATION=-
MAAVAFPAHFARRSAADDFDMSLIQSTLLANPVQFQIPVQAGVSRLELAMMLQKVCKYAMDEQTWSESTLAPMDHDDLWSSLQHPEVKSTQEEALRKLAAAGGYDFEELMGEMVEDSAELEEKLTKLLYYGPKGCSGLTRVEISMLLLDAFGCV